MKEYSQLQKFFSVLMIFILLIQLAGCSSYKTISRTDLPLPDSIKYSYIVHTANSKYLIENTVISNGILSGKINDIEDSRQVGNKIHLYLPSDSDVKIDNIKILRVSLDKVIKVEVAKADPAKTVLFLLGCTIIGILVYGFIQLSQMNY